MTNSMMDAAPAPSQTGSPVKPIAIIGGLILTAGVFFLDYTTSVKTSILAAYLVPVVFSTWLGGAAIGLFFTVACAAVWYVAQYTDDSQSLEGLDLIQNAAMRLAVFWIVHALVVRILRLRDSSLDTTRYDAVTGLPNRAAFFYRATVTLGQRRSSTQPMSFVMVDILDLHALNAQHGQQRGDLVISLTGHAIRATKRPEDVIARTGGDEFVLLMPATSVDESAKMLELLRARLVEVQQLAGCPVRFTIVHCQLTRPPLALEEMLNFAEGQVECHRGEVANVAFTDGVAS